MATMLPYANGFYAGPYNENYNGSQVQVPYDNGFYAGSYNDNMAYGGGQTVNTGGAATNLTTQSPGTEYRYSDGSIAGSAQDVQGSADTQAAYQDMINQLNGQVGNLDQQQNVGLGNIANSFNLTSNRLNEQKGLAQRNYNMGTDRNARSYANTRGGIMSKTGASANALQRLLGMNGAGNSSASYEQAPYAAARMGTQNLSQAQEVYGNNRQSMDMNWDDAQRQYKNLFEDAGRQKYSQENSLKSSIASTRAGLLEKIAGATAQKSIAGGASYQQAMAAKQGYQDQVNSLLQQITQLGSQYANPVIQTGDVTYKAPELGQYSLGNNRPVQTGGAASDIDQTFLPLLAQQRDEYGNVIV